MLPSAYKRKVPDDFIGPARRVAHVIDRLLVTALPTGVPVKLLLLGRPGLGKTALANSLPASVLRQIATFACGNVRQALLDADNALLNPSPDLNCYAPRDVA